MKPLAVLLLILPALVQAEVSFIPLKHRSAESLIPLLQPVVDEGVGISGRGPTLIVNSSPRQLEEIRQLVEQLDTALQSLMISVTQGGSDSREVLHGNVSGTLEQARVNAYAGSKREGAAIKQQLRVIEGQWAFISSGESVPLAGQTIVRSHHGSTTRQTIEYKDVQSGFEVRPDIHGEEVTLEVRPFRAMRSLSRDGTIAQQEIVTTVSGRLGEWITIGGVDEKLEQAGIGTIYARGKKRNTTNQVKLKVERLPNE